MAKKVEKGLEIMKFRDRPKVKVVYRNNPNAPIWYTLSFMAGVLITLGVQNLLNIF